MADEKNLVRDQAVAHPRPRYLNVLIALVVLTALEVAASYLHESIRVPILVVLAGIKAALVILYFMHLKFDPRLYSLWFTLGAVIVIPLIIVLALVMPLLR